MQLKKTFSALVVNRSGGVGKTLLTQALRILMASPAGEDLLYDPSGLPR